MNQASEQVVEAAGGTWDASLNLYNVGGNCMVATQQVDEWVYVVAQDSFDVTRHSLAEWAGTADITEPVTFPCEDATGAWKLLRLLREDCLIWQCGACDAWIFTSNRPRIGILRCSTCVDGGIDFRHADRHVGGD